MKTEKHRKLKGSVLLTVVSVLSIMIIFMTCALAMAAAANKRSRKTYSSSQSSYTARTAIDSILAAIGTDKEFSKSVRALKNKGQKMDILVDVNDPSMGYIENATIENVGKKVLYDSEKGKWVERNLFSINADVTIGGETTSITSKILQDPPSNPTSENTGGAAFLTYGDMTAVQKVLGFGGTYIGMGQWEGAGGKTYKWNNLSDPEHSLLYYYWGTQNADGTKKSYKDPGYFVSLKDKKYLTHKEYSVKNASFYEAPWVVNGDFETKTAVGVVYTYQDNGIMNNGAEIWGDLILDQNANMLSLRGTDKLDEYLADKGYDFMSMPYLYIDGTIKAHGGTDMTLGHKDLPLNIFMGYIDDTSTANERNIYGDLYLMDKGAKNKFVTSKGPKLLKWTKAVAEKTSSYSSVCGSIYCNGDLEINSGALNIEGDLVVDGDLTITGNSDVNVGGDIVVGGQLLTSSEKFHVNGKVYCGSSSDTKIVKAGGKVATLNEAEYEKRTVTCVLCDHVGIYHADWGGATEPDCLVYMSPSALAAAQAEYGVTGRDFGNKTVDAKYYTEIFHAYNNPADSREEVRYFKKGTDEEVAEEVANTYSDAFVPYTGLDTKREDISVYKDAHDKRVYPLYATRDVLIGAERFLNVKGVADHIVEYADIPAADVAAIEDPSNTYNAVSGGLTVTSSCTLTGKFTDKVVVKPPVDTDIYIRLKNVDFFCNETEKDGKTESDNNSFIEIDESDSGSGHAYFVYDGNVTSNYDFDKDLAGSRLVKTVYDWMSGFNFGATNKNNIGYEGEVYGTGDAVDQKYIVNELQPDGTYKTNEKTIKDFNTLPTDPEDGRKVITGNTTLVGGYNGAKIKVVAPATGDVWLTLDGTVNGVPFQYHDTKTNSDVTVNGVSFYNDSDIMVDDVTNAGKGNVNIYLKGHVGLQTNNVLEGISSKYITDTLTAEGGKLNIVSKRDTATLSKIINSYGQKNDDIPTLEPLRTMVYAADGSRLTMRNGAMVVGYVKGAETLTIDVAAEKDWADLSDKIYYDGMPLSKLSDKSYLDGGVSPRVAFIGMLNALNVTEVSQNDWFLLYDAPAGGGGGADGGINDAEGLHKYDAVEYVAYSK